VFGNGLLGVVEFMMDVGEGGIGVEVVDLLGELCLLELDEFEEGVDGVGLAGYLWESAESIL
jgi:hypothetical protein